MIADMPAQQGPSRTGSPSNDVTPSQSPTRRPRRRSNSLPARPSPAHSPVQGELHHRASQEHQRGSHAVTATPAGTPSLPASSDQTRPIGPLQTRSSPNEQSPEHQQHQIVLALPHSVSYPSPVDSTHAMPPPPRIIVNTDTGRTDTTARTAATSNTEVPLLWGRRGQHDRDGAQASHGRTGPGRRASRVWEWVKKKGRGCGECFGRTN